ncbi:MAG: tetratricopeptide repeat protein [Candidatus Thorarchaeota archaeon]
MSDDAEKSKMLEQLIQQECKTWEEYAQKGYAFIQFRKFQDAVECLSKAARMNPTEVVVLNFLAQSLGEIGQQEEKLKVILWMSQVLPKTMESTIRQGQWLKALDSDMYVMAMVAVRSATTTTSDEIEELKERVRKKPKDHKAWLNLGIELAKNNSDEKAIEAFKRVLALKPKNAEAWLKLGDSLGYIGEHDQARDAFRKVIELKPRDARAWLGLGLYYIHGLTFLLHRIIPSDKERSDSMVEKIESAIQGTIPSIGEKDIESAEKALRTSVTLDKNTLRGWQWLGVLLMAQEKIHEAEDALKQAVNLNHNQPLPYMFLALLYKRTKRIRDFEEARNQGISLFRNQYGRYLT